MAIDYKSSGVDVAAGERLVDWIKNNQPPKWPHQERIVAGVGGFAALFRAGFPQMQSPCLVSSTDGVGTKLKLAIEFQSYSEVAQDLVAMCVNDLICCGATPLFFLDYYACGKLELNAAKEFLSGLQKACLEARCALIGGETAEMPGMYKEGDFDCAGFSVGVVDEAKVLGSHLVKETDKIIAIESSGFHSNGFSFLRKVLGDEVKNYREELLRPTHLYVALVEELKKHCELKAVANITGGGLDNLLRVMPKHLQADIQPWDVPEIFRMIQKKSDLPWEQMLQTLNCGLGLLCVVSANDEDLAIESAKQSGFKAFVLGELKAQKKSDRAFWKLKGDLN